VISDLIQVVGVTAYDQRFPIFGHLMDALSYPIIEGSNVASAAANSRPCSAPPTTTLCTPPAWPDLGGGWHSASVPTAVHWRMGRLVRIFCVQVASAIGA